MIAQSSQFRSSGGPASGLGGTDPDRTGHRAH